MSSLFNRSSSVRGFFTMPRQTENDDRPVRPLRNYSTLGPSRPPRKKNVTDEEKQNGIVDIMQYIEIIADEPKGDQVTANEDPEEPKNDLQSGDVIQKMKDRPLPAPPRPPRKTKSAQEDTQDEDGTTEATTGVEKRLILPSHYSYEEETITCGSLVVQPLDGSRILPDSELSRPVVERIIPITTDLDDYEESEIPEEFTKLGDPPLSTVGSLPQTDVVENSKLQAVTEPEVVKTSGSQSSELEASKLQTFEDPNFEAAEVRRLVATPEEVLIRKSHVEPSKLENSTLQTTADPEAVKIPSTQPPLQTLEDANIEPAEVRRLATAPQQVLSGRSEASEISRPQRLQLSELDVDRLTVNELLANKLIVSEIESNTIETQELSSRRSNDIELPAELIRQLLERFRNVTIDSDGDEAARTTAASPPSPKEAEGGGEAAEKKTPIDAEAVGELEVPPRRPPRRY